jgi:preprotein translocase subunit SecF
MFIVTYRKIFYIISVLLIAFSFGTVAVHGLNFGIDFKGGSIIEVEYTQNKNTASSTAGSVATSTVQVTTSSSTLLVASVTPVTAEMIRNELQGLNIGETVIRQAGDHGFIIRTKSLNELERRAVIQTLGGEVKRFDSVGPVLGQELQGKAIWSIILVMLAIVLFITFVFRHVSKPVASWKYGVVAIVALLHDVIIPTGIFAYLGRNGGYEVDALFVTALLVILGFSIHDTIVVFDRTRENLKLSGTKKTFEKIVGESVSQTISRSINTSLTTVLALVSLYFFGPETTRNFSLALIIGIVTGTYSSIFIGSPLLVTWERFSSKK